MGGTLTLYRGRAEDIVPKLVREHGIDAVFWNRCYEPWCIARDKTIKATLSDRGTSVQTFNAACLWEPWTITKADGTPYKVFSPFYYKGCLRAEPPPEPEGAPTDLSRQGLGGGVSLGDLGLLPDAPRWDDPMVKHWDISEGGAATTLERFLASGINQYKKGRDYPATRATSRLSPYLAFGQISPRRVWHSARALGDEKNIDHFCSELGWREFSRHLLFHFPDLPQENFRSNFGGFPWVKNDAALSAWQRGQTGIPIIDAGMRELWATGYMHNRVRMLVASFLVKNLLIHWREGENWFWDTLFDADLANNSASWQWVAGSGADAAPYFRIFNPVTQSTKFDPDGGYIKKWVPELGALDGKHIYAPWDAPEGVLDTAGVRLGETYPKPLVDLKRTREGALAAYQEIRKT